MNSNDQSNKTLTTGVTINEENLRRSSLYKLLTSLSIYTFAAVFNKGVGFLLLPVFTYYLSPEDYGLLSLVNTYIAFMVPFIMIGSASAIRRQFFQYSGKDFQVFSSSALTVAFTSFLFFLVLFLLFAESLSTIIEIPTKWTRLIPIFALFVISEKVVLGLLQVQEKPKHFALLNIGAALLGISLGLYFVVGKNFNYEGRLYGILIAGFIFTIVGLKILGRQNLIFNSPKKEHIIFTLKYGIPIIAHLLGALTIAMSDRIFIAKIVDIEELGIYSVGYTLGGILALIESAFGKAYTPFLFKSLKSSEAIDKKRIVMISYGFILCMIIMLIFLWILAPFIFKHIIDSRFEKASDYIFWIGLGFVFSGIYRLGVGFIFYSNRTIILAVLAIINVILNLVLNYFLINHYGTIGAAYATCISFFIVAVLTCGVAQKIYPMPWLNFYRIKDAGNFKS